MFADWTSEGKRPGTRRIIIARAAAIMMTVIVVKMATPPPRGTVLRWYLSSAGCATKPTRAASFLTMPVKMSERANEPRVRPTANAINF